MQARHKAVYATVKEQHWFSREWYPGSKYIQQYSYSRRSPGGASQPRPQQLMGDGTPDYIWAHLRCLNRELKYPNDGHGVTVAEALAELNPAARLVVMFRDPVERLWSDFFYFAQYVLWAVFGLRGTGACCSPVFSVEQPYRLGSTSAWNTLVAP